MDLDSPSFYVCAVMISLLGAASFSNGDKTNCPCPAIVQRPPLTESPQETCFQINSTFRFKCVSGYVRQVGTSNLITCKQMNGVSQWFPSPFPSLRCKPNPKRTVTQPPKTTVTTGHTATPHDSIITSTVNKTSCPCPAIVQRPPLTESPQETCFQINSTFRFKCVSGHVRQVGTSNLITCKQMNGASQWFPSPLPSLRCKPFPTSLQTQSTRPSASETAGAGGAEPTSVGGAVPSRHSRDFVTDADAADGATPTSPAAEPPNNGTVDPRVSAPELVNSSVSTAAGVGASLVIICALVAFRVLCYRRRWKNNVSARTVEEQMPMHRVPSGQALSSLSPYDLPQ